MDGKPDAPETDVGNVDVVTGVETAEGVILEVFTLGKFEPVPTMEVPMMEELALGDTNPTLMGPELVGVLSVPFTEVPNVLLETDDGAPPAQYPFQAAT